jgi:SAM-dependent methyltransferase
VQVDSQLGANLSRSRLELNLGFPLEFLKGMNVLELGSGPGRFTEHFVAHARSVVAVDLSEAIFHNSALGRENLLALQADLMEVPKLSEPIDLVFCRGVIQHTASPRDSIRQLFEYARPGGLVIFDVYKKESWDWRSYKYFWRPFFQKNIPLESFGKFLKRHGKALYRFHHVWLGVLSALPPLKFLFSRTPLYIHRNWDKEYPNLTSEQRIAIFEHEFIDAWYAHYDQPMTPNEVLATTSAFGQLPYSYDLQRNHFRYVRKEGANPVAARFTKNGALPVLNSPQ